MILEQAQINEHPELFSDLQISAIRNLLVSYFEIDVPALQNQILSAYLRQRNVTVYALELALQKFTPEEIQTTIYRSVLGQAAKDIYRLTEPKLTAAQVYMLTDEMMARRTQKQEATV